MAVINPPVTEAPEPSLPALSSDSVPKRKLWGIIGAASAGTVIEWYDFYIFGALATTVSPRFYPSGNQTLALLLYLSTFAVGFVVRPFGALVFGRIGDLVGRKYAFLVTLLIMGCSTAAIGLVPSYDMIGVAAPVILVLLRILQGLALGGEYGGAAVYVAEHTPDNRRGFYTSFIQITATLGLFISLAVIQGTKAIIDPKNAVKDETGKVISLSDFDRYGWRICFLLSIVLVAVSLLIRLRMKESPIFSHLKSTGQSSTNPLKEAFTSKTNLKRIAVSLFGATAGQGVVWYTGQFYALFYLKTILKIEDSQANKIVAVALLLGLPMFILFGWLSDLIGRKRLMMGGLLLAAICYFPIYQGMRDAAGTQVERVGSTKAADTGEVKLVAQGTIDGLPVNLNVPVRDEATGDWVISGTQLDSVGGDPVIGADGKPVVLTAPAEGPNEAMLVFLIFLQLVFVCMVYGPIAAYLVEAFPAKVRYTSMSLPYHIGNGIFGGLLPLIGLSIATRTHSIYAGLLYPIVIASVTFVIGMLVLKETRHVRIWDEIQHHHHHHHKHDQEPTPTGV